MKNASQTTGGLISTLKDNAGFAFRDLAQQIMKAFDFKGLVNQSITFFQSLKSGIANATPLFSAIAATVKTAFTAIWEVASVTMQSIGSLFGVTSGNLMQSLMTALGIAKFVFAEWPSIAELAFKQMALSAVVGFNTITHFFTGVLPALFNWFGRNWFNLFSTAGSFVWSVFKNMHKNVFAVMKSIFDYIASGGTKSLSVAWVPLLEGFKNTVSELPNIPDRAIGSLEKQLQQDVAGLANRVGTGMAKEIAANLDMLKDFRKEQETENRLQELGSLPDVQAQAEEADKDQSSQSSRQSEAGTDLRTTAGLNFLVDTKNRTARDVPKLQLAAAQKANEELTKTNQQLEQNSRQLAKIARGVNRTPQVVNLRRSSGVR